MDVPRRIVFVTFCAAIVVLTACYALPTPSAASQTPTMTATATPAASTPAATGTSSASDELVAVAKAIYPYSTQYGYYSVCGVNGDLSHCPVTDRLRTLLTQRQTTLCGCQNPSLSMEVTAAPTATGGVAHVVLGSPPGAQKFDLIVVRSAGALLVDDQECTGGGPSTSIYVRNDHC